MKKKILFLYNTNASWVNKDKKILASSFTVTDLFVSKKSLRGFKWIREVLSSDILFCWFGSLNFFPHIILGKLARKKIMIVTGGFDVAKNETFHYGAFTQPILSRFLRRILFKLCDKVLAVSQSNADEAIKNAGVPEYKVEVVSLGFDLPDIKLIPWQDRENQIVMISSLTMKRYYIKGANLFIDLAEKLPDVKFVLVGSIEASVLDLIKSKNLPNLILKGFVEFGSRQFQDLLNESKIIAQFSHYEGFGAAVVDGSLFGCFPIVTNRYALPGTVGKMGEVFEYEEIKKISAKVNDILKEQQEVLEIQKYFYHKYANNIREQKIIKIVNSF